MGTLFLSETIDVTDPFGSSNSKAPHQESVNLYGLQFVRDLRRRCKRLFAWQVVRFAPYQQAKELSWFDTKFRNRIFKIDLKNALLTAPRHLDDPSQLTLPATGSSMYDRWPQRQQVLFSRLLRGLHQKQLRIGTTCSGSDICVSVISQTLEYFTGMQAWYV